MRRLIAGCWIVRLNSGAGLWPRNGNCGCPIVPALTSSFQEETSLFPKLGGLTQQTPGRNTHPGSERPSEGQDCPFQRCGPREISLRFVQHFLTLGSRRNDAIALPYWHSRRSVMTVPARVCRHRFPARHGHGSVSASGSRPKAAPSGIGTLKAAQSSQIRIPERDYLLAPRYQVTQTFHKPDLIMHLPFGGICRCAGQCLGRQTLKFLSYRPRALLSGCSLDYLCSKMQKRLPR
jgi:hypothetical protein